MADTIKQTATETQKTGGVATLLLWPGDKVADLLDVTDPDGRMLLRMFVNLTIYGKLAVLITLMFL